MSDQPEYLTCLCNNCSQGLEFPADGVGTEIECPSCGMTTRLYRPASIPIPPPIRTGGDKARIIQPAIAAVSAADSQIPKPSGRAIQNSRLHGSTALKMAPALVVVGTLGAMLWAATRQTTTSGQVFIVTKGAENVKLGAVEVLLIERQEVTEFLRRRQIIIDAEIRRRQAALEVALREVASAASNATKAKADFSAALAQVPTSAEYVKIKAQKDALSRTNDMVWSRIQTLQPRIEAVGIGWLSTYSIGRDYNPFDDGFVMRNLADLKALGIDDMRKVEPLLIQLDRTLHEFRPDMEQNFGRELRDIQQHVEDKERPKVTAAENAIAEANTEAESLREALSHFPAIEDYLSGFRPAATKKAQTDADGKFSISYPHKRAFTLYAKARRETLQGTEIYCWLVDAPRKSDAVQVFLSNNNLTSVDPDGYFQSFLEGRPDYQNADQLLAAASGGDPEAQCKVASNYWFQTNYAESVKWYRKAAEQGYARAEYYLGSRYAFGEGVPKDLQAAREWFTKAAAQGNADAARALAKLQNGSTNPNPELLT